MSDVTTSGGFITRVEDVTVKPTRLQSEVVNLNKTYEPTQEVKATNIPQLLTLERAIKWYEENAVGEISSLYLFTALQLRKLLSKNVDI